jgi:hypothetical protein
MEINYPNHQFLLRRSQGVLVQSKKHDSSVHFCQKSAYFCQIIKKIWKCMRVSRIVSSETISYEIIWKLLKLFDSFWNYFFWIFSKTSLRSLCCIMLQCYDGPQQASSSHHPILRIHSAISFLFLLFFFFSAMALCWATNLRCLTSW